MTGEPVEVPLVISGDAKGAEAAIVGVDGKLRGLGSAYGTAKGGADGLRASQDAATASARQAARTQEDLRAEIFQVNEALRSARQAYRAFGDGQEEARREALANIAALESERTGLQRLASQAGRTGGEMARGSGTAQQAVFSLTQGLEDMTFAGGDVSKMLRYGGNNLVQFAQQAAYVAREAKNTGQTMLSTFWAALRGPAGIVAGISIAISLIPTFISWLRRSADASKEAAQAVFEHRTEVYKLIDAMREAQGVAALGAIQAAQDEVDATNRRIQALNALQAAYQSAAANERTVYRAAVGGNAPVQQRLAGEVQITEQLRIQLINSGALTAEQVEGLNTTISRNEALRQSALLQGQINGLVETNRANLEEVARTEARIGDRLDVRLQRNREEQEYYRGLSDRTAEEEDRLQRLVDLEEELQGGMRSRSELAADIEKENRRIAAAEKKLATARGREAREAEQARREAVERAFALRGIEIELMEDSAEAVRATVALEFDRRREQMRQQFGILSDDLDRQIHVLQGKATAAALAELAARQNAARQFQMDSAQRAADFAAEGRLLPSSYTDLSSLGTETPDPFRARAEALDLLRAKADAAAYGIENGLLVSVEMVDEALQNLSALRDIVRTDEEREQINALIERLEALGGKMEDVGTKGYAMSDVLQDAFSEAMSGLSALQSLYSVEAQNASEAYRAAVERDAAALEARGVAAEEAQERAEAMNTAALAQMDRVAEKQKRLARIQVITSTAAGIAKAFMDYGWPAGILPAAMIAATGAIQLRAIDAEQISGGSGGGGTTGTTPEVEDVESTIIVGRTGRGGQRGAAGAVVPSGSGGPILSPSASAALAMPKAGLSPQGVSVSVTQGGLEVIETVVETDYGRVRQKLRREDARVRHHTGGRR